MKVPAVKIYTNSFKGNLSKLLEKAKQPLATQDKFELSSKNSSNTNKTAHSGCGCYACGCGGCCD